MTIKILGKSTYGQYSENELLCATIFRVGERLCIRVRSWLKKDHTWHATSRHGVVVPIEVLEKFYPTVATVVRQRVGA